MRIFCTQPAHRFSHTHHERTHTMRNSRERDLCCIHRACLTHTRHIHTCAGVADTFCGLICDVCVCACVCCVWFARAFDALKRRDARAMRVLLNGCILIVRGAPTLVEEKYKYIDVRARDFVKYVCVCVFATDDERRFVMHV